MGDAVKVVHDVIAVNGGVLALLPVTSITTLSRPQAAPAKAVTLSLVSNAPFNALAGHAGLDGARVQLSVWAIVPKEAHQIADACRVALQAAGLLMTLEFETFEPDTDPALAQVIQEWSVFT